MTNHPPILYYIIHTPTGYEAKFDVDDGRNVQEKIIRKQKLPLLYKGTLSDHTLIDIILDEIKKVNLHQKFNPSYLESRLYPS
jgi:hypothetical protein